MLLLFIPLLFTGFSFFLYKTRSKTYLCVFSSKRKTQPRLSFFVYFVLLLLYMLLFCSSSSSLLSLVSFTSLASRTIFISICHERSNQSHVNYFVVFGKLKRNHVCSKRASCCVSFLSVDKDRNLVCMQVFFLGVLYIFNMTGSLYSSSYFFCIRPREELAGEN